MDVPLQVSGTNLPVLQWGHGREAMDGAAAMLPLSNGAVLQWGHGREAMDGERRPVRWPRPQGASMGPRP